MSQMNILKEDASLANGCTVKDQIFLHIISPDTQEILAYFNTKILLWGLRLKDIVKKYKKNLIN